MATDPVIEDFDDDEEEGVCPDCGAAADEECEADCPSWDEED